MITTSRFLISFEVPGYNASIGFTEEMMITYRTEELTPYLRYPNEELNKLHLHIKDAKRQLHQFLEIDLTYITIIDIIALA